LKAFLIILWYKLSMIKFTHLLSEKFFHLQPFPHWIIPNILPVNFIDKLGEEFPSSRYIHNYLNSDSKVQPVYDQNTAYRLEFGDPGIRGETLNMFANYWAAQKNEILEHIKPYLPSSIQANFSSIQSLSFSRGDFRASSPVNIEGTVQLGPHLDSSFEILAGLIYLKNKFDSSNGGDLTIYTLKDSAPAKYMSVKRRIPILYLDEFKTLKYAHNFGLFFISHPRAIHGVSARSITKFDRQLINLSIELPTNQKLSLFKESDMVDFSLTNQFQNKYLRKLQSIVRSKFGLTNSTSFGQYNWAKKDNL
jgi:hypothetical protein